MAGFILGTGSGVLAAAAVYYTISTEISASTSSLRSELHNSSRLLSTTLDPSLIPAPSSFVGPQPTRPPHPPFSTILQSRWNLALGRSLNGIREADLTGAGLVIWEEGKNVLGRLGKEAGHAKDLMSREARQAGEVIQAAAADPVVTPPAGKLRLTDELGGEEGMVKGRSYTGGEEGEVATRREVEKVVEGRMV